MPDPNKFHQRDDGPDRAMPRYVSHKRVWALEIDTVDGRDLSFRDAGYAKITLPAEVFARYTPVPGDFYVVYADGYKSFSPRKAFLEGYKAEKVS
jgi:hypothetical protein